MVETLGAVLLLSIALVGPMVIVEKGLQASLIAKDQNTAFNLAQDAVEYIRFARDTNCLTAAATQCPGGAGGTWLYGTVNLGSFGCISADGVAACTIDSYANTGATCGASGTSTCPVINYNSTTNNYTYSTGANITPSIFTRAVQIQTPASCSTASNTTPCEADITVTVSWNDPLLHSIVVKESLYDWQ